MSNNSIITINVVQPKMSPLISFSGIYQKQFLLCWNMTNLWCRAHMYILTCFFTFVCCIKDSYQYYNIHFQYMYVFKCCYHDIELCFVPYFGAEFETMFILEVYIYLPCINTQWQTKAPFDNTPVISYIDKQKTGFY